MNNISFTPNFSQVAMNANPNLKNRTAFRGLPNHSKALPVNEVSSVLSKAYKLVFIPFTEKVVSISKNSVQTVVKKSENCKIQKEYPLMSRHPRHIIKDYSKMGIRKIITPTKGKKFDYEVRDMHDPNYRISVTYKGLTDPHFRYREYDGDVILNYCDKELNINAEKRKELIDDFTKSTEDRYRDEIEALLKAPSCSNDNFSNLLTKYYKDPEVIGKAILTSPHLLNDQIAAVNTSLPHGLKCIIDKLGK